MHAGHLARLRCSRDQHVVHESFVAAQAVVLEDARVVAFDMNGLVEILEREADEW
jgi:hypothetical protein